MANRGVRYTPEFKRQVVGLGRPGWTLASLAKEFGPSAWTIALWVKQSACNTGDDDDGQTSSEREELQRLRRDEMVKANGKRLFSKWKIHDVDRHRAYCPQHRRSMLLWFLLGICYARLSWSDG